MATKQPISPILTPASDASMDEDEVETRARFASEHGLRLTTMLEMPAKNTVPFRVFRTRYWLHGEYCVVSLTHAINTPPGTPTNAPIIHVNITRSHAHGQQATNLLSVGRIYDVQSIVAFLNLDEVDPDTLAWQDTTKYSDILVYQNAAAESVLNGGGMRRND